MECRNLAGAGRGVDPVSVLVVLAGSPAPAMTVRAVLSAAAYALTVLAIAAVFYIIWLL